MINMVNDLVERHNDAEIVEYLYSVMVGITKNYKLAIEKGTPELLYACLGDLTMVTSVLQKLKKRNDERAAQAN